MSGRPKQTPHATALDALGAFETTVRTYAHYPSESFRSERLEEVAAAKAWLRSLPTEHLSRGSATGEGTGIGGPTT